MAEQLNAMCHGIVELLDMLQIVRPSAGAFWELMERRIADGVQGVIDLLDTALTGG